MKLLAIIEAGSITGPAKNLLAFCENARCHAFDNLPRIETTLATFQRAGSANSSNEFIACAQEKSIPIEIIEERFRFDTRIIGDVKKLVNQLQPEVIQTHNVKSHFLVNASGLWRDIPWVIFHHGYTATDFKMQLYNQLDRISIRNAARVVTMNQAFGQHLEAIGAKSASIRILHNAVDVENLTNINQQETENLKTRLGIADNQPVVIAIGRLSKEKGHLDLIRAFARLLELDAQTSARLLIVGDGPERPVLEETANNLGLKARVVFAGQISDVKPFYALADLLVLPSHSEGSPNVLLEAMAARVPAIATAVGGVPEIATHNETAWLVNARDTQAMAQAMRTLLTERAWALQLAENAQQHIIKHHSPDARLRSLLEIYREVVPTSIENQVSVARW
ncbi:MAG: glycosyltransferase family 4 protein [Acidobacteriota bacterium]